MKWVEEKGSSAPKQHTGTTPTIRANREGVLIRPTAWCAASRHSTDAGGARGRWTGSASSRPVVQFPHWQSAALGILERHLPPLGVVTEGLTMRRVHACGRPTSSVHARDHRARRVALPKGQARRHAIRKRWGCKALRLEVGLAIEVPVYARVVRVQSGRQPSTLHEARRHDGGIMVLLLQEPRWEG